MPDDPGDSPPDPTAPPKTFTQEDLDRVVGDRLKREREKYAGFDDMKRKAEEFDKLAEAQKTEHEKALEKAKEEAANTARTEERTAAHGRILKAEVRLAAAGKLADPEDAVRFLDLSEIKVNDDGEVDAKAITKAIDQLVKEKPYLAGQSARVGSGDGGARGGAPTGKSMNDLIRQAVGR